MDRRQFVGIGSGLALLGIAGPALAALTAGKEYVVLSQPLQVDTTDKVEVREFFWYGCPHCNDLEPLIEKWLKNLPKDVEFMRQPTIFRDSWAPGAKTFYALEAIGQLQRLHVEVFRAMHVDRINMSDENVLFDWMAKKGVDRKQFVDAYNSFNVQTKTKRAEQLTKQSKLSGVPAIVVDGKYATSASFTGSHEAMLVAVDELIQKARGERKKK
jgi:thiol:disulfide interchange protein DsbA